MCIRDIHLVRQLDALLRVRDIALPHFRIGVDKVLMDRQADQVDTVLESMPLEFLQITVVLGVHLPVQDVHPFDTQPGRLVDHRLDGDFWIAKMPVRVGRNAQLDALGRRNSRFGQTRKASE